jgi:predicted acyl esterase
VRHYHPDTRRINVPTPLIAAGIVAAGIFGLAPLRWAAPPAPAPADQATAPAKRTEWVVARDGTRLATDVYLPSGSGPFPAVLARTPYDKNGLAGIAGAATRRGYALVAQDTRGRFASQGDNLPFEGDDWTPGRQDGYDTVEWIARQPWSNGKVGTWGGSALGITQLGMAGNAPPHLTCQHITVATPSFYHHGAYPGGVFKKAMVEDWLRSTRHSPEALPRWTAHPDYDAFWRERELEGRFRRVNVPAVHIGGWYDIFTQGTLDAFVGYQTKGGPGARGRQKLVMGPWTHGPMQRRAGELTYPENAAAPPSPVHDVWRWFEHWLQPGTRAAGGDNGIDREPSVTYYLMGDAFDPSAPVNAWRTADRWPIPAHDTAFYLTSARSLAARPPAEGSPLTYRYDPSDPAPTAGGPQLTLPAGPRDQKAV